MWSVFRFYMDAIMPRSSEGKCKARNEARKTVSVAWSKMCEEFYRVLGIKNVELKFYKLV